MSSQQTWGILTDVTKCIGCEACVEGCRKANDTGPDRAWPWKTAFDDLSATRWTTIDRLPGGRYVRRQCRHCDQPACASACPVGALTKTPEGPVVYDAHRCMGCRYCMMACPFLIPRYSWEEAVPSIRKCILCFERIQEQVARGEKPEAGCTAACPTGATIFGPRDELLEEAKERIRAHPDLYIDHVYGETEAGGTAILNISDVDIGLPDTVPSYPLPGTTWPVLKTVPFVFVGMGAAMLGMRWVIGRRDEVRAAAQKTEEEE